MKTQKFFLTHTVQMKPSTIDYVATLFPISFLTHTVQMKRALSM